MRENPLWSIDPEVRRAYSEDTSGLIGMPDAVARPASEDEVVAILRHCHAERIPVTPQGLRSSMVGGPLAMGGLAMSLERMARVIEIDPKRRIAIVEPGVNLGEMKHAIAEAGLFYPPDPTSENECCIGGTILTNASGARTYAYGSTRRYIRGMRVALADGTLHDLTRKNLEKNTAGYFGWQDPIDLFIGSEGTLGVVTRATLDLLPAPPGFFSAMAFFRSLADALAFVLDADRARRAGSLTPRCLELFDDASLDLIRPSAGMLRIPDAAQAAIFFEQECPPEEESAFLERWLAFLEQRGALAEETIVASNEEQHQALRGLRHELPTQMNEMGTRARENGGMKLSTDWAVPLAEMPRMVEEATRIVRDLFGGPLIRYGHIGDGHPHFNLVAENPEAFERAREATHRMARLAVESGGTVAAEHGVGKMKKEYLPYQHPAFVLEGMRAMKRALDPFGILAPGNLIDP